MSSSKENLSQNLNLSTVGCLSIKEASLHWCEYAAAKEESSENYFDPTISNADLQVNPFGSTDSQSHENDSAQDSRTDHWEDNDIQADYMENDEEEKVDNGLNQDYGSVQQERSAAYNTGMIMDAVRDESTEEEKVEGEMEEEADIQYNDMEVESDENEETGEVEEAEEVKEVKEEDKKPPQSKYKNKPKELLERAVKILSYYKTLKRSKVRIIVTLNEKSEEDWLREGELLRQKLEKLEEQASSVDPKMNEESEKTKEGILEDLEDIQYCRFADLLNYRDQIKKHKSKVSTKFNKGYKNSVSHKFFRKEFKPEELFDWVLLLQIALILIPRDEGIVELLPLRKETVCFCAWLFESPLDQENKDLYKTAEVRNHMRDVLAKAFSDLMDQAYEKLPSETFTLSEEICSKLRSGQRSQRPVFKVLKACAVPRQTEAAGEMTGQRNSLKARLPIIDIKIKKGNTKRKRK